MASSVIEAKGSDLSLRENALDKLVAYRAAHLAWKQAPEGPEKVRTKAERGKAHSDLLAAAELVAPIVEREREVQRER